MLNLYVRPMKLGFLIPLVLSMIAAQDTPAIAITSPKEGEILRGQVTITGTTDVPNFISAQLDFAYASNAGGNWFTLQTLSQPAEPEGAALFTWDTTSITDGDYILRLRVSLSDGTFQDVTVPVRIQNDTSIPTATPVPTATQEDVVSIQNPTPFLLAASPTPTEVPRPTPTPLPANPVALSQNEIYASLGRGALVIIGLFVISGIALRLRRS